MKQNQKNRYNGRYNSRNSRTILTRNTALESTGPMGKLHGTALQLFEKYQSFSKDALTQNDLILAQTCMQYADHYMRLQNIAISNEQTMRVNNFEQRSSVINSYADKTEYDSLPEFNSESGEIEQMQASESDSNILDNMECSDESVKQGTDKPEKRRTCVVRRRIKAAPKNDIAEKSEAENLDSSFLKQDLSVPILDMQ